MLQLLIRDRNDGIMIPIPQYPLYSASITCNNGTAVNYFLNEEDGWSLDINELEHSYNKNKENVNIRALAVINPGNPTGQCLSKENIEHIIDFCISKNLVILADEVYQENIWDKNKKFHSFREVAYEMNKSEEVQLCSFHSVSKGFLGECGRRGGYVEMQGIINNFI